MSANSDDQRARYSNTILLWLSNEGGSHFSPEWLNFSSKIKQPIQRLPVYNNFFLEESVNFRNENNIKATHWKSGQEYSFSFNCHILFPLTFSVSFSSTRVNYDIKTLANELAFSAHFTYISVNMFSVFKYYFLTDHSDWGSKDNLFFIIIYQILLRYEDFRHQ